MYGGEGGIRTPDSLATMSDFETEIVSVPLCYAAFAEAKVPVLIVVSVEGPGLG